MTVRENLEFPLRRHWLNKKDRDADAAVKEALEDVGLYMEAMKSNFLFRRYFKRKEKSANPVRK